MYIYIYIYIFKFKSTGLRVKSIQFIHSLKRFFWTIKGSSLLKGGVVNPKKVSNMMTENFTEAS